jgi:hypothetical protein
VGTGFGIQALLASRHAEHVVATDINERALAFARFNAALNGITNVEFRVGSFFEPVRGETFGLVVCNPPYVISPETAFVFRDSGLGRDRVSERLVGDLPTFLDEGGFATIMVSWIQAGDDVAARPSEWLRGTGCDAWILHTSVEDTLTAAANWNRDRSIDEGAYAEAIDRWLEYFGSEGIDALAYGAIVLRRRTPDLDDPVGLNWIRSHELPNGERTQPAEHVFRLFTGTDQAIAVSDDALADERIALVPGATIATRVRRDGDGWDEADELVLGRGIPFRAQLDPATADLLRRLDGSQPYGDVLDSFADAHDAAIDRVRTSGFALARRLLEEGMAMTLPGD